MIDTVLNVKLFYNVKEGAYNSLVLNAAMYFVLNVKKNGALFIMAVTAFTQALMQL